MRVVFIGPPGSGKGTQAEYMKKDYSVCHLSTGDMLREAVAQGTSLGLKAKGHMDSGHLVPDDVIIGLIESAIKEPRCAKGFILDGFPRTIGQGQELDVMLQKSKQTLNKVFEFKIDDSILVSRITGRRVHPASGRTYHTLFAPPKVEGKDDLTGEPLVQRKDDNEDVLKSRLQNYHQYTAPVLEFYKKKNLLATLDAKKKPAEVYKDLKSFL